MDIYQTLVIFWGIEITGKRSIGNLQLAIGNGRLAFSYIPIGSVGMDNRQASLRVKRSKTIGKGETLTVGEVIVKANSSQHQL
jgi:hypothetical protein